MIRSDSLNRWRSRLCWWMYKNEWCICLVGQFERVFIVEGKREWNDLDVFVFQWIGIYVISFFVFLLEKKTMDIWSRFDALFLFPLFDSKWNIRETNGYPIKYQTRERISRIMCKQTFHWLLLITCHLDKMKMSANKDRWWCKAVTTDDYNVVIEWRWENLQKALSLMLFSSSVTIFY